MIYRRILLGSILALISLNVLPVSAIPVKSLDLVALTSDAHVILVGKVTGIHELARASIAVNGQSIPARVMSAVLDVSRVIKGRATISTISFKFFIPDVSLGYAGIAPAQFGMFFLRRESPAAYVILNPYYPYVIATPDAPVAKGSDLDRVTAEVVHVLMSSTASLDERKMAISVLEGVKTETATAALRYAAGDPDMALKLDAISALLRRNDISMLAQAEKLLLHPPENTPEYLLNNLAFGIGYGVKDIQAIPTLTHLLSAPAVEVRRNAAAALRQTHDEAAIEPLSMALEDGDREVRYEAVMGLAEITKQDRWAPSVQLFSKDEERFLNYWRDWVRTKK